MRSHYGRPTSLQNGKVKHINLGLMVGALTVKDSKSTKKPLKNSNLYTNPIPVSGTASLSSMASFRCMSISRVNHSKELHIMQSSTKWELDVWTSLKLLWKHRCMYIWITQKLMCVRTTLKAVRKTGQHRSNDGMLMHANSLTQVSTTFSSKRWIQREAGVRIWLLYEHN